VRGHVLGSSPAADRRSSWVIETARYVVVRRSGYV
jgi:hypothetical protein